MEGVPHLLYGRMAILSPMYGRSWVLVAVVVAIVCVGGTLTAFGISSLLQKDDSHPGYSVSGSYSDGTAPSGTATCGTVEESAGKRVLEFRYSLVTEDGRAIELVSHLIVDLDGIPTSAFHDDGSMEILGNRTTRWVDPDGGYTYCISSEGEILAVLISAEGVSATAFQRTP